MFCCKHIILKISKLLRPFTSVEDVSTKYSFQTFEHFSIAFLRGQIWRPDQIFHPIYFHLDLKHTHLDPVCNIRSEYTFNERIYLHIPKDYLTFWNEYEYKFIQTIRLCISFPDLNLINTKSFIVTTAFFRPVYFLATRMRYFSLFCPILSNFSFIVAKLRTFWWTYTDLHIWWGGVPK